jgi:hypothetical protein
MWLELLRRGLVKCHVLLEKQCWRLLHRGSGSNSNTCTCPVEEQVAEGFARQGSGENLF